MFSITRIYADANGDSHFEDISIPLTDAGDIGFLSEKVPASGIIFREVIPTYDYTFHNAPSRQYIVLLDGGIEIETSLGEKRIFQPGDVLLAEDITGKGHRSKMSRIKSGNLSLLLYNLLKLFTRLVRRGFKAL